MLVVVPFPVTLWVVMMPIPITIVVIVIFIGHGCTGHYPEGNA